MKALIKKIFVGAFVLMAMSTILLVIHIYAVTQSSREPGIRWQLTRVEFNEAPLSPATSVKARQVIDTIPDVMDSYLNIKKGTLVYATEKGSFKSAKVFDEFIQAGSFDAVRYAPEKGIQSGTSCPVLDKKSITYRIGSFFQEFFKNSKTE